MATIKHLNEQPATTSPSGGDLIPILVAGAWRKLTFASLSELFTAIFSLQTPAEVPNDVITVFTFSGTPIIVFRNGVNETRLGTIGPNTFTFDTPPATDDDIEGLA